MTRMAAKDFDQELLDLYDFYAHGMITKRQFLDRAGKFAVGGVTAVALLNMLSPNYAMAQQVSFNDPDIHADYITYASPNGTGDVRGYLVRPAGVEEPLPGVLVIHENRGLNPYIEDVARRLAKAGFMALAPDGLTSVGGYPGNDADGRELQKTVDRVELMNDFFNGFEYLLNRDDSTGKVGAVGFCYGGGVVSAIAVAYPELAAGVPFYGRQPAAEDVAKIQAPLLIQMGELDERINEGWPDFEAALQANDKVYEAYIYENANHGFHNDSTPRYDEEMANLAWDRTIDWLNTYLK
ncbi:prolyl oligopeptidase family serine peptidase [Ruegeria atlantica]|uniref:Prolyl oligopeptidase family serine peptidase n=1 Tax=Ruegeria atlantica TaxID=81569 RepID=A0AA90Z3X9_9RHOB|nr:YghX family hydrolase [Ruegeria atlantica]NOE19582.1 prolyl oligopeptidase family serine peptidase [Ruegeria atlantica]